MNKTYSIATAALIALLAGSATADPKEALAGLDFDGDGLVTIEGAIASRMPAFYAADLDQDGALSEAEHGAMMAAIRARFDIPASEPQRGQVDAFTFADKDADGFVTAEEFRAISERIVLSLDKDGDGMIRFDRIYETGS